MTRNALVALLAACAVAYFVVDSPLAKQADNRCDVAAVTPPNYNPLDSVPDNALPSPEELLPPRSECPELYEGQPSRGTAPPVPGFDPGGAPKLPEPKLPGPTPYPPEQPNPNPYGPYS